MSAEPSTTAAAADTEPVNTSANATEVASESASKPVDDSVMDVDDKPETSEVVAQSTEAPQEDAVNGDAASTPAAKKSSAKRKSFGTPGTGKKLNRKKSMPDLHLDVQPGQYWYVRMKGYPPWPAIICDEEMLPASLLSKRPVSAQRVDGTYREDFAEGGKNVRDRRYPIMFLGTNEFAWQVNTDLAPLDIDELKGQVERNEQGKKSKALWQAFEIAAEENDLDYFKTMLQEHEQHVIDERDRVLEIEAKKAAKKDKKSKAKVDDDGDVDMDDAEDEGTEKKKTTKKRKKSLAEGEESGGKKPKIVLKGLKSGEDEQPKPKKQTARKPKAADSDGETKSVEPVLSAEEKFEKRKKTIYFLRHKLQKGLVSRSGPPQPDEVQALEQHLTVLEQYPDLEPEIIKETKVNKLMKIILKLTTIPRDEEFKFKERCQKLLTAWTNTLNSAGDEKEVAPETNGKTESKAETAVPVENGKSEEPSEKVEKAEPETDAVVESTEKKEEAEAPAVAA